MLINRLFEHQKDSEVCPGETFQIFRSDYAEEL